MISTNKIPKTTQKKIDKLVNYYKENLNNVKRALVIANGLLAQGPEIESLIHSSKSRVKDPEHLRDKLERKAFKLKSEGKPFCYSSENFFEKVTDLAGIRLLHLYPREIQEIDKVIRARVQFHTLKIVGEPEANVWDKEFEDFYRGLGFKPRSRPDNMYMSVHYIIQLNSEAKERVELQVRTLMEEVWGQVDHTLNYPHKTKSIACSEQLKVLARVTSSGTRLVDSIFLSNEEHKVLSEKFKKKN